MAFDGFSAKAVIFDLFLNSASSSALRDKHFFICILNVARQFFFILDVIEESEDDEGIPLFILPVTDDLIFFCIAFRNIASGLFFVVPHLSMRAAT